MNDDARAQALLAAQAMPTPPQIGDALVAGCVAKAAAPARATFALGVLGGAFIALGAAFYTAVMVGVDPGLGVAKAFGGLMFSMGLGLVLIAGAELFTGNAMMLLAFWRGRMTAREIGRNWGLVLAGNAAGALGVAGLMHAAGLLSGPHGAVAAAIAEVRLATPLDASFAKGVLCNTLVCLAVWMSLAARTASGKAACAALPVAAFVTLGLEHSIANLYLLPAGLLAGAAGGAGATAANVAVVALGNLAGAALVAGLYACALGGAAARTTRPQPRTAATPLPPARAGMPAVALPRASAPRPGAERVEGGS